MPISFRTYNDPGVYIETITPPVVFTSAIEPTILAIVGSAPSARSALDSVNLVTGEWVDLSTLGGDPGTVNVTDKLLGTQYVSAGIGTLVAGINDAILTFDINLFDAEWIEPVGNFAMLIEDEEITVNVSASSITNGVYSVTATTRGVGATTEIAHGIGQVANIAEGYADSISVLSGTLNTPITATTTTLSVTNTGPGVLDVTYLDVEGERMIVTNVAGVSPNLVVTVVRGVAGTTAKSHGAVGLYVNTGADYLVKVSAGLDATYGTADDVVSLKILEPDRISNGTFVNVTFDATDTAQFDPTALSDMDNIRDKYGDPLDSSGQVNSALTLAAQLAIANGATQLVLVATNPDDSSPVQDAIDKLNFREDVNSVVALSGVAGDISYLKDHVTTMSNSGQLRRAFIGLDGVSNVLDYQDFIDKAAQLHTERVSLVAPSRFKLDNGTGTPVVVPGYYAAAAVAGLQAGQTPQEPLTRKQVFGFVGIDDQDSSNNIFLMQAGGVLVVYEDRFGRLIIKHGLTTDMTTTYTREISVITSRDRLRDFILETLEGGALVGSPMTAETPNLVLGAVSSALEESMRQGLIFEYGEVVYRFPTENATMIEIRFSYKPTLPLNYILVQFSIDTNTGTVEFQSINENTST